MLAEFIFPDELAVFLLPKFETVSYKRKERNKMNTEIRCEKRFSKYYFYFEKYNGMPEISTSTCMLLFPYLGLILLW